MIRERMLLLEQTRLQLVGGEHAENGRSLCMTMRHHDVVDLKGTSRNTVCVEHLRRSRLHDQCGHAGTTYLELHRRIAHRCRRLERYVQMTHH